MQSLAENYIIQYYIILRVGRRRPEQRAHGIRRRIRAGTLRVGAALTLVARPHPEWPVKKKGGAQKTFSTLAI
jgi:hypothetical protein